MLKHRIFEDEDEHEHEEDQFQEFRLKPAEAACPRDRLESRGALKARETCKGQPQPNLYPRLQRLTRINARTWGSASLYPDFNRTRLRR